MRCSTSFGYKKGADGYRNLPDGKPLVLQYWSIPIERDRQFDELLQRSLDAIGVRVEIRKERFAELIKLDKQCRLMMRNSAWIADYPDGDNFMQLLYGPNTGQSNGACYRRRNSTACTRNRGCCRTARRATSSITT